MQLLTIKCYNISNARTLAWETKYHAKPTASRFFRYLIMRYHEDCSLKNILDEKDNIQEYYCRTHDAEVCRCYWEFGYHFNEDSSKLPVERRPRLLESTKDRIIDMYNYGMTYTEIASKLDRTYSSVQGVIRRYND